MLRGKGIAAAIVLTGACAFDGSVNLQPSLDPTMPDAATANDDSATAEADGTVPPLAVCPDDPALVLCLEFEDSLLDASGYGNNAVGINYSFAAGVAGQALAMNSSSGVKVGDAPSLRFGPEAMTLEGWVFPQTIPSAGRVGVVDQDGGPSIFIYANGDVQCYAGGRRVATGPGKIAAGSWVHLACTHSSGTTKIYIDGEPALEDATGGNITSGTIGMAIGGNSPSGDPFDGRIDNLRVWTLARSATDICVAADKTDC